MAIIDVIDGATGLPWRAPRPWSQLVLPGIELPLDDWHVLVAGPDCTVRVHARFHSQGLWLCIADREPSARALAVGGHAPAEEPVAELFLQLFGSGYVGGTFFGKPLHVPGWSLGPDDWGPRGVLGRLGRGLAIHIGASTRAPALLLSLLADIAERVTHLCDPRVLPTVRAFHPAVRVGVHALLVGDPTGRVAQLAAVAPGLVTMMAAGHGREVLPRVLAGERLHAVADAVIAGAWPLLRGRARVLHQRRWLLRAPVGLDPTLVNLVAPADVPLDDIPMAAPEAAAYFEVIAAVTDKVGHDDDVTDGTASIADPLLRRGLLRFVSRHAVAIHAIESSEERLERLIARIAQTGQGPTRRAPLEAWLPTKEHTTKHARLLATFDGPLGKVVRLDTKKALYTEAREMKHCVATFADLVAIGHVVVLRLEARGHRATLALTWDRLDRVLRATDFAGPGNRRPTAPMVALARAYATANPGLVVGAIPPVRPCA